ncbi:MAG: cell division protein SepF [Clostridiales bacterium]|jgi:FtsZ-interacting cell division protein YlmF|nr:cell division protein SepF [Clostridiales bacterium]
MGFFDRNKRNPDEMPERRRDVQEYYEDTHNDRGEYTGMLRSFNNDYQQRRDRRATDKPSGGGYASYPPKTGTESGNTVSLNYAAEGTRRKNSFMIYEPKTLDDVQTLIDFLKRREPAVINLKSDDAYNAQRILDFVSGAIYALNGTVHRIEDNIFILSPEDVEITIPYKMNDD